MARRITLPFTPCVHTAAGKLSCLRRTSILLAAQTDASLPACVLLPPTTSPSLWLNALRVRKEKQESGECLRESLPYNASPPCHSRSQGVEPQQRPHPLPALYRSSCSCMNKILKSTASAASTAKALLHQLKAAEGSDLWVRRAAVSNMSSILSSIQNNDRGGLYPYRASKTAPNAITKFLSIDLRDSNTLVGSVWPGWVQTDMSGRNAPLTPAQSIANICIFSAL
ncbi:uncharacterized protein LOC126994894 [Eriocheir sinensis]|uniref:uncharacterized protein LOC126994894 n=1 Tax=Eriocheir sinensis TaxID=95602 RepID=UPI0021C8AC7A|nr:uncharacterized protein LOC126994894 [Eriocheir sinensis]